MSVVKINAITVPRERFGEFAERFAARAGSVSGAEGFEAFELLRPNDDRDVCLVYTRWRSEDDFQTWQQGQAFQRGHAQAGAAQGHGHGQGPAASGSQLWSFEVVQSASPKS